MAIFPKRLTHCFSPKMTIFQFFFCNIGQQNAFYDILEPKIAFLGYKNKKFKTSKNGHFSKRVNPWFWSKNCHFSNFFCGGEYKRGQFFLRLYGLQKQEFLKKLKNRHFSKGVNPRFLCKNGHFSNFFFLGNIGQENVFSDILERQNAFLCYKNKKFKKQKNGHFFKGFKLWFWSKNNHFSKILFQAI